jgi:acetyl esterase/lipase
MYTSITYYWLRYLAARGIACEVLSVDYPLAPEHPFPEGLLAAVGAYQWLEGQLSSDTVLVVGG